MFALSEGVSNMPSTLPRPAYAVLSGLNAATVGVVALAAVQLSRGPASDGVGRVLVFVCGSAGLLYNALWYFPVLIVAAGLFALAADSGVFRRAVRRARGIVGRARRSSGSGGEDGQGTAPPTSSSSSPDGGGIRQQQQQQQEEEEGQNELPANAASAAADEPRVVPPERNLNMSWKAGLAVIAAFLTSFAAVMVLRATLRAPPLLYRLFANMYLAGTVIFGGGPVVIPLLREYVVAEGWVSPRDFLIGLAVIQALPGPNFNFAVYLGALTARGGGLPGFAGAAAAFAGIFAPGLALVQGTMGVWTAVRGRPRVGSLLRGVNAGAVGLIYTAVYRLWQIGYIDEGYQGGTNLGVEPWWVVVTATSYVGGMWFGVKPWASILLGAAMGLAWYGVESS